MRVKQNLFDFGDAGTVLLSTCSAAYGTVPATPFGQALLWRDGTSVDLSGACTRPVPMDAQLAAIASLRKRLAAAVASVHAQIDWLEARLSDELRELPSCACQLGGNRMLLGFVGVIEPSLWRLVDVATQRILWESDPDSFDKAFRRGGARWAGLSGVPDMQLPIAFGADFVEIQRGMARPVFVLEDEALVLAEWSVKRPRFCDHAGLRSGLLESADTDPNAYALIDPRNGQALRGFSAPTRSKGGSQVATTPGCDRIAISHPGGTVDIVDGLGEAAFSLRPFPQLARTDQLGLGLSQDARWLGADAWSRFRVVDLDRREVAELAVPEPNLSDDPTAVLHDRCVLATVQGVAVADASGLRVVPYAELRWETVVQPGRRPKRAGGEGFKRHLDAWRKPALALRPARRSRSWLYGAVDLPADAQPQHAGRPMALLACIDLSDASRVLRGGPWPVEGALCVFTALDDDGAPLLDDAFNPRAIEVQWRPETCNPGGGSGPLLAPNQPLTLVRHPADLPDLGAAIVQAAQLEDADAEAYRAWLHSKGWDEQPNGHRLGGYPTILQRNDMEAQAQQIAAASSGAQPEAVDALSASRWRLLLQLDSDAVCQWGTDSGVLYLFIHDEDLARQEFSRVVALCEGF